MHQDFSEAEEVVDDGFLIFLSLPSISPKLPWQRRRRVTMAFFDEGKIDLSI